jgi:hypothetical protein
LCPHNLLSYGYRGIFPRGYILLIVCYSSGQLRTSLKLIIGFIAPKVEMVSKLMI